MAYEPFGGTAEPNDGDAGDVNDANPGFLDASFLGGSDGANSGGSERDARGVEFDPEQHSGRDKRNADGSWTRKRGRKSGSGSSASAAPRSRTKADNQASVDGLASMLGVLHLGIAAATKTPALALKDDEAKNLALATARVLEEFDIRPEPKIEAIVGLIIAGSSIYGPRAYFIMERRKKEAAERRQNQVA